MVIRAEIRYRADEIWDSPEDGNRYEVIDGRLYVSPPPLEPHQSAATALVGIIWPFVRSRGLGKVYAAPFGVVLDDGNGVQPDVVYVSRERQEVLTERGVKGAPDLVVEILSRSTEKRDRGIKMKSYAAAGVLHYWIVDPRARTLEAYRLTEDGYELVNTSGPGTTFRPELFPGLEIPIDELWR
jgi:Uma2 family endonuclease